MKQRRRIYFSAAQQAEIWDRWQAGESMKSIGRRFDRGSSSVFSVISPAGGIRPAERLRAPMVLSPGEREEIARAQYAVFFAVDRTQAGTIAIHDQPAGSSRSGSVTAFGFELSKLNF